MSEEPKRLLTAKQLAEYLQVSAYTVARWKREYPDMPVIELPKGGLRFDLDEVKKWLADRKREDGGRV